MGMDWYPTRSCSLRLSLAARLGGKSPIFFLAPLINPMDSLSDAERNTYVGFVDST